MPEMAGAERRFEGRHLLQIAPMMEVTYKDFRYFMRLLSRRAQLWTEMVVDDTILHNTETEKCDRFLRYNEAEHPIVCQLGGSDPTKLAQAAEIVQRYGYDEVNLNCGCPSSRVAGKGEFGCSLMKKKDVVREAIRAMSRAVQIPVTVKCRLGADEFDSPEFTRDFVRTVAQGGCKHFIIHARKAWLSGLSPAQNRTIPPLHYPRILDLCHQFPDLKFSINGGITDVGHARALLGFPHQRLDGETEELYSTAWGWPGSDVFCGSAEPCPAVPPNLEGVMIGRGAMNSPCMLWDVDHSLYGEERRKPMTRRELLDGYREYLQDAHTDGTSVGSIHLALKPTLGILAGIRGNKAYRATADKTMRRKDVAEMGPAYVLEAAIQAVDEANPGVLDEALPATVAFRQPTAADTPRGQKRKPAEVVPSEAMDSQAASESGSCAGPMEAVPMASPAVLAA